MRGQPPFVGSSSVKAVTQGVIICSFVIPGVGGSTVKSPITLFS